MSGVRQSRLSQAVSAIGKGLLAVLLLIAAAACAPSSRAGRGRQTVLRLAVADSCGALAERLAEAYERERPWVTVEIEVFNSAVAERRLREGQADLALLSWLDDVPGASGFWSQEFAPQGVAVIAHSSLSLDEADLGQLQAVFWAQLREADGQPVEPVSREEGSGTRALFERAVLGDHGVAQTAVVMPSSRSVVEYVQRTPGTVGYVSTHVIGEPAEAGVRVVAVEGVLPSAAAVADGSYPLSNRLRIATVGEPRGEAREFAQWLLGPGGQEIVWSR